MSSPAGITTRSLSTTAERLAAVRLYRAVFGLADDDPAFSPKLLCALQHSGGSALGAFDEDDRLVGFTYGFVGLDGGTPHHYSQTAAVAPAVQGRGVGRQLKRAQAEVARRTGVTTMRWAYDPLQARNAHFNLDVLGATGRWFHRDYYGMPDHHGRTDRVVVEWPLDRPARAAVPALPADVPEWGAARTDGDVTWLAVPAAGDALRQLGPERALALRDRVADEIDALLGAGRVLRSCLRADARTALYCAVAA
ncbi:GNAT family N-acetyltransferase [Pseudonocardia kunmingensis]|uniref:Putative GNAT superfamily acetyltransferase n=1 Tax=Pseudonocardia kunmingensis TaxID=630975 RepID=A0A543DN52_9PSEU|nr:GNAT family N-acetyltransferase [Pseudonocardia kunmingensis]TQM10723.1 putative GNAT superfamily acetyltransferase [Pseudonocardia kunmingensis]